MWGLPWRMGPGHDLRASSAYKPGRCLISSLVVSGQPPKRCSLEVGPGSKGLPTDAGCHAAIDCVASVFPFTSTARKRM